MKKALWVAACLSAALGTGVFMLSGDGEAEGLPWEPLNEKIEAVLAVQEGTIEEEDTEGKSSNSQKSGSTAENIKPAAGSVEQETVSSVSNPGQAAAKVGTRKNEAAPDIPVADNSTPIDVPAEADFQSPENAAHAAVSDVEGAGQEIEKVPSDPAPHVDDGKIHINSADAAALMELPGIGEKKAQAILDYRAQNGPFRDVTDMMKVKGIGPKMLEKMLPDLGL